MGQVAVPLLLCLLWGVPFIAAELRVVANITVEPYTFVYLVPDQENTYLYAVLTGWRENSVPVRVLKLDANSLDIVASLDIPSAISNGEQTGPLLIWNTTIGFLWLQSKCENISWLRLKSYAHKIANEFVDNESGYIVGVINLARMELLSYYNVTYLLYNFNNSMVAPCFSPSPFINLI